MRKQLAIFFSGLTWFLIGSMLIKKGVGYLAIFNELLLAHSFDKGNLMLNYNTLGFSVGSINTSILAVSICLGFFKGAFVLRKTSNRIITRIKNHPASLSIKDIYPKNYLILIFSMMIFGASFKYLPIYLELKAIIDFAVGSALCIGSVHYFRSALAFNKRSALN